MKDYSIIPMDLSHPAGVRELYHRSFGLDMTPDYFNWKYLENPAGHATAMVAMAGGRVAAFYGVIPEHYLVDGEQVVVHQSMDTMTDPDHRGKGLFIALAKATYEVLSAEGKALHVIGYPGPTSFPGFVKRLGWKSLAEFKYLFLHRPTFAITGIGLRDPGFSLSTVRELDPEWDAVLRPMTGGGARIRKYLDTQVIGWRTLRHPAIGYVHTAAYQEGRPAGLCIHRMDEKGRAFILLVQGADHISLPGLVAAFVDHIFRVHRASAVFTFVSGEERLQNAYHRCGFVSNPFGRGPFSYRTPFIVLADGTAAARGALDIGSYAIQPITRDY